MRRSIIISVCLGVLTACDGHNLDSAINTCKSVTEALAGDMVIVWQGERETEQAGEEKRVTLDFSLQGHEQAPISQAVCVYGLSSEDMDYRTAFGEYENAPSRMLVNGRPIPQGDLIQAVNLATANAAKAIGERAVQRSHEIFNQLKSQN